MDIFLRPSEVLVGTAAIHQVAGHNINPGIETMGLESGLITREFVATLGQRPTLQFSSTAVSTALTASGLSGKALTAAAPLKWQFKKQTNNGGIASGSVHVTYAAQEGVLVPTRLTASQGQIASVDFEATLSQSGATECLTRTASQAALTADKEDEAYTIGGISINGTDYSGALELAVDFGCNVQAISGGGLVYPIHTSVMRIAPSATFTTLDEAVYGALTHEGARVTAISFTLRKVEKGERLEGDNDLTITIYDGTVYPVEVAPGRFGFRVEAIKDDTNAVIAVA
jgi:hypothetical protein